MKNIEELLPSAIKAVKEHVLVDNLVPKEFNGYISSFGASLIMSGLLPTIVFFSQEGKSKGDRKSVIKAIEKILNQKNPDVLITDRNLLKTVETMVKEEQEMQYLQDKIQEAGIALKLAIRIFPKSKKESKNE